MQTSIRCGSKYVYSRDVTNLTVDCTLGKVQAVGHLRGPIPLVSDQKAEIISTRVPHPLPTYITNESL